ncbi:MAG: HNH endonuclease [Desulfobacterales bacterium]|nr:HNH endonuclease [Desulfobacterales bacterium]
MKWLRMWTEWAHDPKVQAMPEAMQRRHVVLLCLRRQEDTSKLTDEEIASYMRISMEDLQETKELFQSKNFIDNGWNVLAWEKRQFESDKSAERTRRYRDRREEAGLARGGDKISFLGPQIFKRDGGKCVYCNSVDNLVVDHILPISQGGTDDELNLAASCRQCNSGKSGRTPDGAGYQILNINVKKAYSQYLSRSQNQPVTVTVTPPDTDTDTEAEFYTSSKKEEVLSEPPAQTPPCPHGKIKELYNKNCKSLPGLLTMSKQRKAKLKTRWGEHPNLEWWQALFETVEQIPFCCGDNDRGWKASFDWLVANDTNALKVMEGKYFKQEVLKKSDGLVGCKKCTLRSGASTMDLDEQGVCWSCRDKRGF